VPLDHHHTIADAASFVDGQARDVLRDELNDNFEDMVTEVQGVEDRMEDTFDALFDSGVVYGMAASIGSGLQVAVSAGRALIGHYVDYAGGNVSVLANSNPGYIYFCQDGTFEVNTTGTAPSSKAAVLLTKFVSDATSVTSIVAPDVDPERVLPFRVRTVSGEIELSGFTEVTPAVYVQVDHGTWPVDEGTGALASFTLPWMPEIEETPGFEVLLCADGCDGNRFTLKITYIGAEAKYDLDEPDESDLDAEYYHLAGTGSATLRWKRRGIIADD